MNMRSSKRSSIKQRSFDGSDVEGSGTGSFRAPDHIKKVKTPFELQDYQQQFDLKEEVSRSQAFSPFDKTKQKTETSLAKNLYGVKHLRV